MSNGGGGIVASRKLQIADRRIQILGLVSVLIVLGSLAWGIGWAARGLLNRQATPPPTATVLPTALPPTTVTPTTSAVPTARADFPSSPTVRPTSTAVAVPATATAIPIPENRIEIMVFKATDRGLYDVVRRACGLSRDYVLAPSDGIVQETRWLNGFTVENPRISAGKKIKVPVYLCP